MTQGLPEAERWLADLQSLAADTAVALYPPREGFGEAEPHAEVAGERVETLERVGRGGVRILLTTARASAGAHARCRVRCSARDSSSGRETSGVRRISSRHLEAVGFERVANGRGSRPSSVCAAGSSTSTDSAWPSPCPPGVLGDEIAELRHFDLLTQRSTRPAEVAVVLPVDGAPVADADSASADRVTLPDLWPPDTIVLIPAGAHLEPELRRTWEEAQHHVELARRRGEDAPSARGAVPATGGRRWRALAGLRHDRGRGGRYASARRSRLSRSGRRMPSIATSVGWRASCATACRR